MPAIVVLDTNLVLSALVFASGRLAWLRLAWQRGQFLPLASSATIVELMRVLGYPKFKLSSDDREQLLADYLPCCRVIRIPADLPTLPRCRDPDDQIFIELAAAGQADFLVTGDKDLLDLAPEFDRPILSAEAFFVRLNQT